MKNVLLLMVIFISMTVKAQVTKVSMQASGLTCSMCSNAINKSLKTLDFVDKIDADMKSYTFEITFKTGHKVDFDQIKRKVEDAGFSVSSFFATIYFEGVMVKENQPIKVGESALVFVQGKEQTLNGEVKVKLLDKGFVPSREYKRNILSQSSTEEGIYHVTIE